MAALLALASTDLYADTAARRFLVIYEDSSTLPANVGIAEGIASRFAEVPLTEREIHNVYLDTLRFPEMARSEALLRVLETKFLDSEIDVVMAVGGAALSFALDHRAELAPNAPIIFGGIDRDTLGNWTREPSVGGVLQFLDAGKTLEFAKTLQPDARQIVVMSGSAKFDRDWAASVRHKIGAEFLETPVTYVSDLSLEGFIETARNLDPDTIVLILTILIDSQGRQFIPREAAAEIAKSSSAPTYGMFNTFVEAGALGGRVTTFPEIGRALAEQALAAVAEGSAGDLPIVELPATNVVNWPELARFGIDTSLVPANARRLYYDPPVWQRYRREISIAFLVLLLQTATIAALLVGMHRRKRLTTELELGRRELAHAARSAQLGQLSGAIAHELNQPLTAILSNAQAAARTLRSDEPDLSELSEILSDIVDDDRRAAAIIRQLRRLMKEGEVEFEMIDLDEVVASTLDLSHSELVARRTEVQFKRSGERLAIHGNMTQLQQVVLNLLLNAADAMKDLAPAERHVLVETSAVGEATCQLAVSDRGPGLSEQEAEGVFKPFVTSKCDGLGLGLSICRSIAKAHGGTLAFDHGAPSGARIVLTLPRP
ncbi:MAG: histidine kinase [Hyphomicrobiaceae bacterium]|nr:histidine kinase [Hyphomicrobiaceae bacterium]